MPTHAVVWIDQQEARIFHVHPGSTEGTTVLAPQHHIHRHPKGRGEPREHPDDAHRFFAAVTTELHGTDAILIVGPSLAKLDLAQYLKDHDPGVAAKVVGIESADHPTDGQIIASAKRYFRATDRMTGLGTPADT
jgi:stalled ribosome rescue protein Dom34